MLALRSDTLARVTMIIAMMVSAILGVTPAAAQTPYLWANSYGGYRSLNIGGLPSGGRGPGAIAAHAAMPTGGGMILAGSTNDTSVTIGALTAQSLSGICFPPAPSLPVTVYCSNIFAARISASGTALWLRNLGYSENQDPVAATNGTTRLANTSLANLAIDASGNVFLSGTSAAAASALGLTSAGSFVVKLAAADGTLSWSRPISVSGGGSLTLSGLSTDGQGNVYVAGYFSGGTLSLGAVTAVGRADMFVAKLDGGTGAVLWARRMGTDSGSAAVVLSALRVAGTAEGDVLAAGFYHGADLTVPPLPNLPGRRSAMLTRLRAGDGSIAWAQNFVADGGSSDSLTSLVADSAGNAYLAGTSCGGWYNLPLRPTGTCDAFIIKFLGSRGRPVWARTLGSAGTSTFGGSLDFAANGDLVMTGSFQGGASLFGLASLAASGSGRDLFAATLAPADGGTISAINAGGATASLTPLTANIAATGTLFWAAELSGGAATLPAVPFSSQAVGPVSPVAALPAPVSDPRLRKPGRGFDADRDGRADLLFVLPDSSQAAIWLLDSTYQPKSGSGSFDLPGNGWQIIATSDLNGDSRSDLVWRNRQTGEAAVWLLDGLNLTGGGSLGAVGNEWSILNVCDLNSDGRGDILWRNSQSGQLATWLMNGTRITNSRGNLTNFTGADVGLDSTWAVAGCGAVSGPSILWRNSVTGANVLYAMSGTLIMAANTLPTTDVSWFVAQIADLDGNGAGDIIWRTGADVYQVWFMDGPTIISEAALPPQTGLRLKTFGHLDGDLKADLIWQDDATGRLVVTFQDGVRTTSQTVLASGIGPWRLF